MRGVGCNPYEAKDKKEVHENVWSALKKIKDDTKLEEDKEIEIIKEAKANQIFLRRFGENFFCKDETSFTELNGSWKINNEIVAITQCPNPDYFTLSWSDSVHNFTLSINPQGSRAIICSGDYFK